MKSKSTLFSKISNTILLVISIFLFFYIWSVNTLKKISLSIIVSTTITTVICGFIFYYKYIKNSSLKKAKTDSNNISTLSTSLLLGSNKELMDYFKTIFIDYKVQDNVFFKDDDYKILLFHKDIVSLCDILPYYKKYKGRPITFLTIDYDTSIISQLDKYNISLSILSAKDIYKLYLIDQPIPIFYNEKSKIDYKTILYNILSTSRSKGYLIASILMILYSMYLPYKALYMILSSILLLLFIASMLFHQKNT